jgi:hypothetical protein
MDRPEPPQVNKLSGALLQGKPGLTLKHYIRLENTKRIAQFSHSLVAKKKM